MTTSPWGAVTRYGLCGPILAFALTAVAPRATATEIARPQEADQRSDHTTRVPGGLAGLARVVGLQATPPRAVAMLEVIRHVSRKAGDPGPSATLAAYFDAVERLERSLAALAMPGRLSLEAGADARDRERLDDVARSLGHVVETRSTRLQLAADRTAEGASRKRFVELAGIDVDRVVDTLNRGEAVEVAVPGDEVPLPLGPSVWTSRLLGAEAVGRSIAGAVLTDPQNRWLYHGLAALDPDTLAFVERSPRLLEDLHRRFTVTFGLFGEAVRVRDGSVVTRDGDWGRVLWEHLVDCPANRPDQFLRNLMAKDKGRLAWFYWTVSQLDESRRHHLLAMAERDREQGLARLRAMSDVFRGVFPRWQVEELPLWRPPEDPAIFLASLAVDDRGQLKGPVERWLWDAAFNDGPVAAERDRRPRETSGGATVDAAWLARRVFESPPNVRRRFLDLVLFAQRAFPSPSGSQGADLVDALRGFSRFPTLGLALERMGVSDPHAHAALVRHASRITSDRDTPDEARRLAQFQGALALVDRAHFAGSIDADAARRLVMLLASAPTSERGDYEGAVAKWLRLHFVAAAPAATSREDTLEGAVLDLLAGVAAAQPSRDTGLVTWEGERYRLDHAAAERERLARIRDDQGGCTLDVAIEAGELASALSATAHDVAAVHAAASALDGIAGRLAACQSEGEAIVRRVLDELSRIRTSKDIRRVADIAGPLVQLGDSLLADALTEVVYASALVDSDDEFMHEGSIPRRHAFTGQVDSGSERARRPWTFGTVDSGHGHPWRVVGSLLGLDMALALFAVRPVSTEPPDRPPVIDATTREVLMQHVVVMRRSQSDDTARDRVASCLAAGRSKVSQVVAEPSTLDAESLAAAGVSGWRREALRWSLRDPACAPVDLLSLAELIRLGCGSADDHETMAAWGISRQPLGGALAGYYPDAAPWELFGLRHGSGLLAARFVDLNLRVAEALSELQMPGALARPVLSFATYDFVMRAPLRAPDDWIGLTSEARRLSTGRIADYIAALTASGPLRPVAQGAEERR